MSRLLHRINAFFPPIRVALWGLVLHGIWEFFQCLFFYDMSGFSPLKGALWMVGATLADAVITVILVTVALWLKGRQPRTPLSTTLIIAGFVVAIGIETLAYLGGWWHYAATMPQLRLFGVNLGLLPLLQMAALPWPCAKLARVRGFDP